MTARRHDLRRDSSVTGPRFMPRLGLLGARPASIDLRTNAPWLPPAFDQGAEGSCGPNSADRLMCFHYPDVSRAGGFSRQQIYRCVRDLEGDPDQDGGVMTKDLLSVLISTGAAPEALWPYVPENLYPRPPLSVMQTASQFKLASCTQLTSADDMLDCLSEGLPFILGFECFESIDGDDLARTGVWARPLPSEKDVGGHDVLVVGYDTNFHENPAFLSSGVSADRMGSSALLITNSWGADWGIQGHFWMSLDFAADPSTGGDAWTGKP